MHDKPEGEISMTVHPVTPDRWADLEALFGKRGACAGCWCMWWRLARSQWSAMKGEGNRQALKQIVDSGEEPGIIGYLGDQPAAWCSVAPRESFPALARSRTLRPIDQQPVWSIVCFFVARPFRRRGLTVRMLEAAVEHVRSRGGRIVEGYPHRPSGPSPDPWVFMGLASAYEQAGFQEVARPSPTRSIMRRTL